MFTGIKLGGMVSDIFRVHQNYAKKPGKAFRKFDGVTPYGVHPTLAAMLILHEETLTEELRIRGAKALLAHDLWEDTTISELPKWCYYFPDVSDLVRELTFTEEQDPSVEIWKRSDEAILYKFYDVTVNLMATGKMSANRVQYRWDQAQKHLFWAEQRHPRLEIIKIAKGLLME